MKTLSPSLSLAYPHSLHKRPHKLRQAPHHNEEAKIADKVCDDVDKKVPRSMMEVAGVRGVFELERESE